MTDGGEKRKRQLAFDEESIVTGSHMTSCNKSSFSRQEKDSGSEIVEKSNFSDVPPRATSIRKRNAAGVK